MNIRSVMDERAEQSADCIFIIDAESGRRISYSLARSIARSIANVIENNGVASGESVAFAMRNSSSCALVVLGIMYGGFRATAINLVSGNQTIAYVLDHSECRLILTEPAQHELLEQAFASNDYKIPLIDVGDNFINELLDPVVSSEASSSEAMSADASLSEKARPFPDSQSEGLLMYTSGTTGRPKGVLLSHANLIAGGRNTQIAHKLGSDDRAMCVLPLYHINGLTVTLMGPLVSAGSVVLPMKFSTSRFWSTINQYKCTWFSVVPTQISYLLHAEIADGDATSDHESLRFGRSASAPLSPEVQQGFENRFGVAIIETMGLTETTAQILSNPLPPGVRKIGSPGIGFGCTVIIADDNLNEVPRGTEGEILVRGENVMKGYFKNPEATSEAITSSSWFRTGDLGKQDEEGYVFVTGRLKELIIKGGENIAPREIDEALYRHPAVIEAAAFACPCENYGQRVEAAVSIDASTDLNESVLLEFCRDHLGQFKMPDRIHFLSELPKGPSGKIQRRRLVELFVEQQ